jgi:hypothetical protein
VKGGGRGNGREIRYKKNDKKRYVGEKDGKASGRRRA